MNDLLSFVILSYNRPYSVDANIRNLINQINEVPINIYIFDDSDNNEVEESIKRNFPENKKIYYIKNDPSFGHDHNYLQSLVFPETDYVWLLGDSTVLQDGALAHAINVLQEYAPDLILMNANGRDIKISSTLYKSSKDFLLDLGWHSTLTGACIYSKRIINQINIKELLVYKNFPQIGAIFNNDILDPRFYWINKNLIFNHAEKKSYWASKPFDVFLNDWIEVINGLPDHYPKEIKSKTILNHSKKTGIFSYRSMLKFRGDGALNINILLKYLSLLKLHSSIYWPLLFPLAIIPKKLIRFCLMVTGKK